MPPKLGRAVFGSKEHARGRWIDGPSEGSPRPKAVERSAGWRRTVDSSPFHTQEKESPHRYRTASATSSDGWPLALTATTMYWVPSTMYVIGKPL